MKRSQLNELSVGWSVFGVAQIFNLLYRRFSICSGSESLVIAGYFYAQQNKILRYSRLKICAPCITSFGFILLAALLLLLPLRAPAATNDLSALLQKGLFEEEANRNFTAASEAYAAVIARFNED